MMMKMVRERERERERDREGYLGEFHEMMMKMVRERERGVCGRIWGNCIEWFDGDGDGDGDSVRGGVCGRICRNTACLPPFLWTAQALFAIAMVPSEEERKQKKWRRSDKPQTQILLLLLLPFFLFFLFFFFAMNRATFPLDTGSAMASSLQKAIVAKLSEFMGDYTDDILAV